MNDITKQTIRKILTTLGEEALAYRFVSAMAGAVERDDSQAVQNELSYFLGEMRFGGEKFSDAVGERETVDVLIQYVGQSALVQFIDMASEIAVKDGLFKNGEIQYQRAVGLARLQDHILHAVSGDEKNAGIQKEDALIASKVFDLSRKVLADVQVAYTQTDAPRFHHILEKINETANSLHNWSTKDIAAPDARRENNDKAVLVPPALRDDLIP